MQNISKNKKEQYSELLNILYDFVTCFDDYDHMIKFILSDPEEMLITEADKDLNRDRLFELIERLQEIVYMDDERW